MMEKNSVRKRVHLEWGSFPSNIVFHLHVSALQMRPFVGALGAKAKKGACLAFEFDGLLELLFPRQWVRGC